jgi:cytochrome c peroxidase
MNAARVLAAWACGLVLAHLAPASALEVPAGWPQPHYRFENNPVTPAGFELGRRLFYEPLLSRDGSTSCASCHQQASAFAHTRHRLSHGIEDRVGTRNAPALFNLAWQPDFMWDGAVTHLELQPLAPLTNALEMDETLPRALDKLRAHADYPARFEAAFGSPQIDSQRLLRALAQFMGSMVSADSAWDRARAGQQPLDPSAARGASRFTEHCAACHVPPLFTDHRFRNNGLDAKPSDPGRGAISGEAQDRGRFRVPSLRNVALTAPYMHDGRFATLDAVLDHYAQGLHRGASTDPLLREGLALSADDRADLLAFLRALTDERFLRDARFAEPSREIASGPAAANRASHWLQSVAAALSLASPAQAAAHDGRRAEPLHLALSAPPVELVATQSGDTLQIYVDDYRSNAPRGDLELRLIVGTRVLHAARGDDQVYRLALDDTPLLDQPLSFSLRGPDLDLRLDASGPEAAHASTNRDRGAAWPASAAAAAGAALLLAGALMLRRRHRA